MKKHPLRSCASIIVAAAAILTIFHLWIIFLWCIVAISALVALLILRDFILDKWSMWRARRIIRSIAKKHPDDKDLQYVKSVIEKAYNETKL